MKKRIFNIVVLLNLILCINAQNKTNNIKLIDCLRTRLAQVDLNKLGIDYVDSSTYNSFNFIDFVPSKNIQLERETFNYFLSEGAFNKVSRREPDYKYQNFDILFKDNNGLIIGFIWFSNNNGVDGNYLNGIILSDKSNKTTYFLYIKNLITEEYQLADTNIKHDIPPAPADLKRKLKINREIKSEDIVFIIRLDENLNPLSRLNFYNGKLFSFSEVVKENEYKEFIWFYDTEETETISHLTLKQLSAITKRGSAISNIILSGTIYPDCVDENAPFWLRLSSKYK